METCSAIGGLPLATDTPTRESLSQVTILEARCTRDLLRWIRFPLSLYPEESPWVAPLERELRRRLSKKNPFFGYGEASPLLAVDGSGRVRGRILAHVNRKHQEEHHERAAFFGYFEAEDDPAVARTLVDAARRFARERGCDRIRGPFNMTAYQELGVLLEGFEHSHGVAETHTRPYYPRLLEAAGLTPCKLISTFINPELQKLDPATILKQKHHALLADPSLTIRSMDLRHWDRELGRFGEMLNRCFAGNWHYLPLSPEEVRFEYGGLKQLIHPELVLVAEIGGQPVGFLICLPDVYQLLRPMRGRLSTLGVIRFMRNRHRLRQASVLTIGVLPEVQARGMIRVLMYKLVQTLQRLGYTSLTATWVGDDNPASLSHAKALGGSRKHRLAIYESAVPCP
jgi:GNAT superfamily N-acetyltransferase